MSEMEKLEKEIREYFISCEGCHNIGEHLDIDGLIRLIQQRDIELNDKWHKAGYIDGVNESKKREQEWDKDIKDRVEKLICEGCIFFEGEYRLNCKMFQSYRNYCIRLDTLDNIFRR